MPCLTSEQRDCVNSSKDLWAIKRNTKKFQIKNSDNSICWTVEEIWLRVWERGITHMVFYVRSRHWLCWCWLLLIIADWWWLLLVAAGCWMVAACGWDTASCCWVTACWMIAGGGVFEYIQDIDCLRLRQFFRGKVFEYFQEIDDLRLRQFCMRKRLWLFSEYWSVAAKTTLQAKKSLNHCRILMVWC